MLDNTGLGEEKRGVKEWYDGFMFGAYSDNLLAGKTLTTELNEQIVFNQLDGKLHIR